MSGRPVDLIDEVADPVVVEAGPHAQWAGMDPEGGGGRRLAAAAQGDPEKVVHQLLERASGAAHLRLELGRHVVIEGKCRTHILMLAYKHHDGKRR
jgi:hypothetical protein